MSNEFFARIAHSSGLRILLLGLLILVLQIPVAMIGALGVEREATRNQAVADISRSWGAEQDVIGPFLVLPYQVRKQTSNGWQLTDEVHHAVLLPQKLHVTAHAEVEQRDRGIFAMPVYTARIKLDGELPKIDLAALGIDGAPLLDQAQLLVRVSDVHAVAALPKLKWNSAELAFGPATDRYGEASGLHVPLKALGAEGGAFSIDLQLRGSRGIYFVPLGTETDVAVDSNWPHPSFQGSWLPKHDIGASGFTSRWTIPYIARGFPAAWQQGDVGEKLLADARFGVDFVTPVDPYRMSQRSLKYAGLFIGLTFVAVWLFEVRTGVRAHAVQYLFVGAAMCLFYLLELSLAEQFGFGAAYSLASGAVIAQIGFYSRSVLKAWPRALTIGALVAALYGLLYVLLREEDYALLVGSIGLFVALSAVMFLTRRVQWTSMAPQP